MDKKLNVNQQHALAAQKVNCFLGCNKRNGQQGKGGDCSPLHCHFKTHVEYRILAWGPQHKKYIELLEQV